MKHASFFAATLALAVPAFADDHGPVVPLLPQYAQECAACHLAYPPGMLPAASWRRLMASLPKHFGTDASLDTAATHQIGTWLQAHAGTHGKLRRETVAPADDRITRTAWFTREHREIAPAVVKRKAVGSLSNCAACHGGAAQGRFSEHDIRIPK